MSDDTLFVRYHYGDDNHCDKIHGDNGDDAQIRGKGRGREPPFTLSEEFNFDTFSTFLWCDQDPPSWLARAHPPLSLVNLPIALSGN